MIGEATTGISFPAVHFVKCPPTISDQAALERPFLVPAELALAVGDSEVAAHAVERCARILRGLVEAREREQLGRAHRVARVESERGRDVEHHPALSQASATTSGMIPQAPASPAVAPSSREMRT